MDQQKILDYGAKLIVIFMCIPIHEYAHAWAATKLGDDTPRYQGRLSLNPLAHLDPIGALCIFFIGFGWGKPVQVNPIRFKNYRKGMALTAAAGPISNIIMGLIGIVLYKLSADRSAHYRAYNQSKSSRCCAEACCSLLTKVLKHCAKST